MTEPHIVSPRSSQELSVAKIVHVEFILHPYPNWVDKPSQKMTQLTPKDRPEQDQRIRLVFISRKLTLRLPLVKTSPSKVAVSSIM
jgi:hypothetical protein